MEYDNFREVGCVFLVRDERGDEEATVGEGEGAGDEFGGKLARAVMIVMQAGCTEAEAGGAGSETENDGARVGVDVETGILVVVGLVGKLAETA